MKSRKAGIWMAFLLILALAGLGYRVFFPSSGNSSDLAELTALGGKTGDQSRDQGRDKTGSLRKAPGFELPDGAGQKHRFEDSRGNVVFLHFWASWCPPCLEEIGPWVELAKSYTLDPGHPPVRFVAVSLDKNWNDAHRFLAPDRVPAGMLSLLDPEATVPDLFGTYQFPETYLIDRQQRIVAKWVGPQDWSRPEIKQIVQRVIELSK